MAEEEHEGAAREQGRAVREPIDETIISAGAKWRWLSQLRVTGWLQFGESIYIYNNNNNKQASKHPQRPN